MSTEENMKECIVAFIDIFGSTTAIKSNAEKSLEMMHDACTESMELFDCLFEDKSVR